MPTEPNLRSLFTGDDSPVPSIDAASIIRRSRRRRLPAQLAVGGATALAVVGIAVVGIQGLRSTEISTSSLPASESGATEESSTLFTEQSDDEIKRAPAERLNLCGGTLAEVAPSATGLVLTASFPEAAAGAERVDGTVTLTNTGAAPVSGYTGGSPAITLSSDGLVLWHSNGPTTMVAVEVDLEPGESLEYAASFVPVACAVEDDAAEAFRLDLPALPAGEYTVTAAVDLLGDLPAELVTGPPSTVVLR